jgi:hypothetical protein
MAASYNEIPLINIYKKHYKTSTCLHYNESQKKVNSYAGQDQHTESAAHTGFGNAGIRIIPL